MMLRLENNKKKSMKLKAFFFFGKISKIDKL